MAQLALPADLVDFPGAPFPPSIVEAACEAVRRDARWHIAPPVTETVTVDSGGGTLLVLPTLRMTAVTEVRDVTGDAPEVLTGWRKSSAGLLYRSSGWPVGLAAVEVDLTHGHDVCPPELLPVIAARCQWALVDSTVSQQSSGPFSVSVRRDSETGGSALASHTLPKRP